MRYDHVGCNRRRPIRTPNLDRLATAATNFHRAYSGSYPSQPQRCDCATGRYVFPFYGWQKLPADEAHLARELGAAGYRTHLISDGDMPMRFKVADGFQTSELVDCGELLPEQVEATPWPQSPSKCRIPDTLKRMWAYRTHVWKSPEDWPQARVFRAARSWLKAHASEPFFLWVESWRIHEPWVDPQPYVDAYDPGYKGEIMAFPAYSPTTDYLTPDELNNAKAMYSAAVTHTDHWLGEMLRDLEARGGLDDTCVIVTSDHGFSLGDHGRTGKHAVDDPPQDDWPLYEECTHVPLLVHLPGQRSPSACGELVQHVDLMPTVLDYAGLATPETVRGASWRGLLEGGAAPLREVAPTALFLGEFPHAGHVRLTLTAREWTLIMPSETAGPELYNLAIDPGQEFNLFARHCAVADDMHRAFLRFLEVQGTDPAKIDSWSHPW